MRLIARAKVPSSKIRTTPLCLECGEPMEGVQKRGKEFCCSACRLTFNNRRLQRGALVYDLFMALRFDREMSKALKVWSLLTRLAKQFRDEDVHRRGGRRSWQPPQRVIDARPSLYSEILR